MTRLPLASARALAIPLSVVMAVGVAAPAWAGAASERTPVIDSAPSRVAFKAAAVISGHLQDGVPGDEVALERRRPGGEYRIIATETADEEGRVAFRLTDLRISAHYRLSHIDEVTGSYAASDPARIRVRPRLGFRLRPTDVMRNRRVRVTGTLFPKARGRRVVVQQRVNGSWHTMGRPPVRDGRFSLAFEARHRGHRRIRVRFPGDARNTPMRRSRVMRVYARALATWYGPGFYGRTTACGHRLTRDTVGVAHRRLPCGTRVRVLYQGRTVTVPVIDRGPYTSAEWDLTSRTARRLDFSGKDHIGVTTAP